MGRQVRSEFQKDSCLMIFRECPNEEDGLKYYSRKKMPTRHLTYKEVKKIALFMAILNQKALKIYLVLTIIKKTSKIHQRLK